MSAIEFYLKRGLSPMSKTVAISGVDTISVWVPLTGKEVVVTDLTLSTNVGGTIAFYFDNTTSQKIAEYHLAGSGSFSPVIGAWESTTVSGRIFARVGTSGTNSWNVNMTGFEIPTGTI